MEFGSRGHPIAHILLPGMGTNFLEKHGPLFGHLVSRFSTHPENLATEALAFILNRSATMREELRNLFGRTGIELPALARFQSQAGELSPEARWAGALRLLRCLGFQRRLKSGSQGVRYEIRGNLQVCARLPWGMDLRRCSCSGARDQQR
jgi:hypothetical protein